ncbi:GNAT family N-acetyltransferase [Quadrisphaera setariae]|uniref:GNAT family N-acetyltransferase n=1 Tax=Quadrisphaera setariae TaxID=2593304 RepID=A0A5C8ZFF6_9ACTN|nr:GNAT family N-acetyltransferase [Quadrisphaera setariae]TXR56592.1 GNAT family N-acetyltransferase [Quadrisphaera setariae]
MTLSTAPLDLSADAEHLADFLTRQAWPFHVRERWTREQALASAADGSWVGPHTHAHWLLADGERAGLVRFDDVDDGTPLFDLRIDESHRRRGLGTAAVRWLSQHLSDRDPQLQRIEANTRIDNAVMRAVLQRCGFVKESHYRSAWPGEGGRLFDGIGHGLMRADWVSGTTTPVRWDA